MAHCSLPRNSVGIRNRMILSRDRRTVGTLRDLSFRYVGILPYVNALSPVPDRKSHFQTWPVFKYTNFHASCFPLWVIKVRCEACRTIEGKQKNSPRVLSSFQLRPILVGENHPCKLWSRLENRHVRVPELVFVSCDPKAILPRQKPTQRRG